VYLEPRWKLAVISLVAIGAGVKLLLTDWSLEALVPFVGLLFLTIGALRVVATPSFRGVEGAVAVLGSGGDIAVGLVLLVWPSPTLRIVTAIVGVWILVRSLVDGTIVVTTHRDWAHPWLRVGAEAVEMVLGVVLLLRTGQTVREAGVTIGVISLIEGLLALTAAFEGRRNAMMTVATGH